MASLPSPTASVPPLSTESLVSLEGATQVFGTIEITSVTPGDPPQLTLSGGEPGFQIAEVNGRWIIEIQPTSSQRYPVVYTLTLAPPEGFPFAQPVGQISLMGQQDGFLLDSATLRIYKASPNLIQAYNLALQFFDEQTQQSFWVGDPTIVFEPPS